MTDLIALLKEHNSFTNFNTLIFKAFAIRCQPRMCKLALNLQIKCIFILKLL
ncbi:hypothetical protein PPRY_b0906 [Pseudoalteromonas prydzensis ACAM 620]|nr:hypothetical protein [Pseudoalteromonas prydzensis ACAM 620]